VILKASQRAGAQQLAAHLLRADENDHVEVNELRGFMADDLSGALAEAQAISKGTRCRQFLFSLSLNPPPGIAVSDQEFKTAIRMVEHQLGLLGQPRAIVFHEKEGRRHAHCVWSRIDPEQMKAINLAHFKLKLQEVSRELFIKHDWRMPDGLIDPRQKDPLNFTREEWQQAKRVGSDPKAVKAIFQQCWAASDSSAAFAKALEERGYWIAKGDRRGFVAVDFRGEVYSISRYTGQKTKDVQARLGEPGRFENVDQVKSNIAARMTTAIRSHIREAEQRFQARQIGLAQKKRDLVRHHRQEREQLRQRQDQRWTAETNARAGKLRNGLIGLWDRLRGHYGKIKRENERQAVQCLTRDREEKQILVEKQIAERQPLQREIEAARQSHNEEVKTLYRDVAHYVGLNAEGEKAMQSQFQIATQNDTKRPKIELERDRSNRQSRGRRRSLEAD
jgi:hypothetical protein